MNRNRRLLASLFVAALVPACASTDSADTAADETANGESADTSAITWHGSSVTALDQASGPASAFSIATPSGTVEGDVEIAAIATYGSITVKAPSGWTLVKSELDSTSTVGHSGVVASVFSHVAAASEPSKVSFPLSASGRGVGTIQSYGNVDNASPIDAVGSAAETTTRTLHTAPTITTTAVGDVLVGVFATLNPHEPASTTSTMAHERMDRSSGNTGSWGIDLAVYDSDPLTSVGKESGKAATSSSATDGAAITLLALRKSAPKPAKTTLFGAAFNPHDQANQTALAKLWGGMQIARSYGATPKDFASKFETLDVDNHMASNFSFKLLPKEVLAGEHDAELKAFFQAIEDDHPTYWTYWHEPDDEIFKEHTFTAPDYRAAWKHIRTIADGVKASRPKLQTWATLIIMEYSMRPTIAPSRPLLGENGMYPGDDVIEIFGVDAYNDLANKGGEYDPDTQFGKVISFAKEHGKPWAVGEFGSCDVKNDTDGRAKYMTDVFTYLAASGSAPVFIEAFNVDHGKCDYRIDNDKPADAVWKKATTEGLSSF